MSDSRHPAVNPGAGLNPMKLRSFIFTLLFPIVMASPAPGAAAEDLAALERGLQQTVLPVPANDKDRDYLGLAPGKATFTLDDIDARILIIEFFSMYCPHCQRYAPQVNVIYRLIKEREALRNKVKLIGIGVGNSAYEVDIFRKKYRIDFPLFDDRQYRIYNRFEGLVTPFFIGVRLAPDTPLKVFAARRGGFRDAEAFLLELLAQAEGGERQ